MHAIFRITSAERFARWLALQKCAPKASIEILASVWDMFIAPE
jgi:hypothetical protein